MGKTEFTEYLTCMCPKMCKEIDDLKAAGWPQADLVQVRTSALIPKDSCCIPKTAPTTAAPTEAGPTLCPNNQEDGRGDPENCPQHRGILVLKKKTCADKDKLMGKTEF